MESGESRYLGISVLSAPRFGAPTRRLPYVLSVHVVVNVSPYVRRLYQMRWSMLPRRLRSSQLPFQKGALLEGIPVTTFDGRCLNIEQIPGLYGDLLFLVGFIRGSLRCLEARLVC